MGPFADSSSGVVAIGGASSFGSTFGPLAGGGTGILGVGFDIDGANHFAWIRVELGVDGSGFTNEFTVIDWAYESDPNTPIPAGAGVPEPSSIAVFGLAMLAAGAVGVRRLRKGKDEPSSDTTSA